MIFAVIGGDERQARLARMLIEDGREVRCFALEVAVLPQSAVQCETGPEAVHGADCVVLPLPAESRPGYLNAPLATERHCLGEVMGALSPGQLCCAGMPGENVRAMAAERGAVLRDYFAREELLAKNAVATAEGALAILMGQTPRTVWGRKALVIGRGRLGRALAPRLKALGAEVTLASRSEGDMAWTLAEGLSALDSRHMAGRLGAFDLIINTVPALMLTGPLLGEVKGDALVLDLASKPGGVDAEAARTLGLRHIHALSLPGKWAPDTAAEAVRDAVYNILEGTD